MRIKVQGDKSNLTKNFYQRKGHQQKLDTETYRLWKPCRMKILLKENYQLNLFSNSDTFIYNHFHNILRLFNVLPNSPFTTNEKMRDYYL